MFGNINMWLAFNFVFVIGAGYFVEGIIDDENEIGYLIVGENSNNSSAIESAPPTQSSPFVPPTENVQQNNNDFGEGDEDTLLRNTYSVITSADHNNNNNNNHLRLSGENAGVGNPQDESIFQELEDETDDELPSSPGTIPTAGASLPNLDSFRHLVDRERDRQRRIQSIRQQVLQGTGRRSNSRSSRIFAAINRLNRQNTNWRSLQQSENNCYKAVCDLPESTNTMLWSNENEPFLRLFFNVPRLNRRGESRQRQVDRARLKLFVNYNPRLECPCPDNTPSHTPINLRVSVYQFTRPLSFRKRNRIVYRRQILGTVTVPGSGNVWVAFDVKQAVSLWMTRSRKNFGLEVMVTYMNGTLLDAREVLSLPRCEEGRERSCREDNDQTIEQVWPSFTIGEDTEPYIDVTTGPRVQSSTSISFPFSRQRFTRSVPRSSPVESKTKTLSKLMEKVQAVEYFNMKSQPGDSEEQIKLAPVWNRLLEKIRRQTSSSQKQSINCVCDASNIPDDSAAGSKTNGINGQSEMTSNDLATRLYKTLRTPWSIVSKTRPSCRGKRITLNIEDDRVLAPRSYTTLVCSKMCRVCSNEKCRHHKCKPKRHLKLRVAVKMPSGKISSQFHQGHTFVTSCGC